MECPNPAMIITFIATLLKTNVNVKERARLMYCLPPPVNGTPCLRACCALKTTSAHARSMHLKDVNNTFCLQDEGAWSTSCNFTKKWIPSKSPFQGLFPNIFLFKEHLQILFPRDYNNLKIAICIAFSSR